MTHFWLFFPLKEMGNDPNAKKDPVQRAIGELGRWQIFVCAIIFLLKFPVAWHQMGTVISH